MKSSLVILSALAVLAGALVAFARPAAAPASSSAAATHPPSVFYGHIRSMVRKGGHYELRFDPAWWLTGHAAEQASFEDRGSRDVPNDYYIVDEGHRLLSFFVSPDAQVTVLTSGGATRTRISTAELTQIVNGKNPNHRRLSEPKAGFWLRVGEKYPNPAVLLFQQYQP